MSAAIEIEDLSKQFRLYNEKYASLKERVIHGGKMPLRAVWALQNVSADINEGETYGILGRNGSGKSTLLKCVAGILKPTSGEVRVRGKLAAMLELGPLLLHLPNLFFTLPFPPYAPLFVKPLLLFTTLRCQSRHVPSRRYRLRHYLCIYGRRRAAPGSERAQGEQTETKGSP